MFLAISIFLEISNYINGFTHVSYTKSAAMALRISPSYQTTTHHTDNTGFTYIKIKLKHFSLLLHNFKWTSDIWHLPELWRIILITLIVKLSCKGFLNITRCIHIVKHCLRQVQQRQWICCSTLLFQANIPSNIHATQWF